MCKSKSKIMRWLLGLMVLAVIAGTSQVAYGQAGVGVALNLDGGLNLSKGMTSTGSFTMTNTSAPTAVSESMTNPFLVMFPACKNQLFGSPCSAPDVGVITINSATSTAGACLTAGITWTVSADATPGGFDLTPSGTITLTHTGAATDICTVTFGFTVNTIPTTDSRPATPSVLDSDSSVGPVIVLGTDASSAAATGTSHNAFNFTCSVSIDKQISCDSGAHWHDVGSASADHCTALANAADIEVRYLVQNTANLATTGVGLVSCNIGESNTVLGPGVHTSFALPNATVVTTGTSGSALTCNAGLTAGEADTGNIDCTCNVPVTAPPHATASDTANFSCGSCAVTLNKEVSCTGTAGTFFSGSSTANPAQACQGITGASDIAVKWVASNTGSLAATCTLADSNKVLLPSNVTGITLATSAVNQSLATTAALECGAAHAGGEPDTGTLSCSCNLTDGPTTIPPVTSNNNFGCGNCAPLLDKQVSCDGGAHFHGVGPGTGLTADCNGITNQNDIVVKYIASETAGDLPLVSCTVTDTNGGITSIPALPGSILGGASATVTTSTVNPLACTTTLAASEPDTATLSCSCGTATSGVTVTATDTAKFGCQACSVSLDKQVSCDGGANFTDVGAGGSAGRVGGALPGGAPACIGFTAATNGTLSTAASQIEARYVVTNTGATNVSCTTPITDTNLTLAAGGTVISTTLTPTGVTSTTTLVSKGSPQACTEALDDFEDAGNTAGITCQCVAPTAGDTSLGNASATDIARFDCQAPGLTVSKSCAPSATPGIDSISITATNPTGTDPTPVSLANCNVTDQFFTNSATCTGTSVGVTLVGGGPFNLNPGATSLPATAMVPPPTFTSASCDQASVTCSLTGVAGAPATITATANAVCPAPPTSGCLLRTPGFFATHPAIDALLLGTTGILSCGVQMTVAHDLAGTQGSAIEDLCSVGTDAKLPGTDQNLTALARACMGANFDLAATKLLGGSVSGCDNVPITLPNGAVVSSGDVAMINNCCNVPSSVCAGGTGQSAAVVQGCLDFVGAFSGLDCSGDCGFAKGIGVFDNPGSADPSICQGSKNNGFRNTCTTTSTPAKIPACGTGRP